MAASAQTAVARGRDWPFLLVALLSGGLIGYAQSRLGELSIPALMVSIMTMFLGAMRPQRPWLWALLVGLCIPAVQLTAYFGHQYFTRGAIFGSVALLAPAFVCAYLGAVGRKLLAELRRR